MVSTITVPSTKMKLMLVNEIYGPTVPQRIWLSKLPTTLLRHFVQRRILQGRTISQVAPQIGCSNTALRSWVTLHLSLRTRRRLKRSSLLRQHPPTDPKRLRKILALSQRGFGIDWIGKEVGMDAVSVRYHLKKQLGATYTIRHPITRFTQGFGRHYYKRKGRIYQSRYEETVDKFLKNTSGIYYPMHKHLSIGAKNFYPDFVLGKNKVIEVAGMMSAAFYPKQVNRKKRYYKLGKIKCLWLYPKDLASNRYQTKIKEFVL